MKLPSHSRKGFSLIETVVGMLVLSLSVVASFEALRLSDLKIRHARIDNRITELLREHSDYVMYVAYDLLPADGAVLSQGSLYQLYDSASQTWKSFDSYTVTANVQASNEGTASEVRSITLNMTYQVDDDSPSSQLKAQTIRSDAISRRKS
jgi:prepilin-type N-terminal cleavage/methylation domain-containing protein